MKVGFQSVFLTVLALQFAIALQNADYTEARDCSEKGFKCNNGRCIPERWQCDNEDDCEDNSDEDPAKCSHKTCRADQFSCLSPAVCIPILWHCDGEEDCKDGSDEKIDCINVTCSALEFACESGKCISEKWRCDGAVDCSDESDEKDCPTPVVSVCHNREFMCANKKDCIHMTWLCDGDPDCPDGSDEANCTNTCRPGQFQCKNLQCIPGQLQCNGLKECPDGSDEENCDLDKDECKDDNGGCSQICQDLPIGYECKCREGYFLADNKTCEDINECETPGACSQLCTNTKGGHKCECIEGYVLEPNNNRRCRAKEGHSVVLFTNKQDIRKIDLETKEYVSVVNNLRSSGALDYNYHTRTIIWFDVVEGELNSAPIDTGTPVTTIVYENVGTVEGIAVDWIYGHIYWTDNVRNKIEVVDKTGKMRKTLISDDMKEPRAIVVDPLNGWIYWTDWGEKAKIERAGMDGTHRSTIVSSDIKWPNGLALDFVSKKIFWADAKLHLLSSADYNGDNRRVIMSSPIVLKHPFSIDVFEDWVYWTDWETEAIHRMNKFTGYEKTDIVTGINTPMDLHIFHSYKQPKGINFCSDMNGHCSHLCLPTPNINAQSARYTCACPDSMELAADRITCITDNVMPSFYDGPDDFSTFAGYHLTFTCKVQSLGEHYTVSWKHFGRNGNLSVGNQTLTCDPRISMRVTDNRIFALNIRDIDVADSGRYMCQINTDPVQRRVGFLDVVVLEFRNPNRQVEAAIGENVILRCDLQSIPTPKTYWKRDGEEAAIESNSKYDSSIIDTGYKIQMSLTIKNVNTDDFGSYMCGAGHSWRNAEGNVTLIEKRPWFAEALPNVTVIAGSDVTLDCVVESLNENYAVAWISLDKHRLLTLKNRRITEDPRFSITIRSNRIFSLRIRNVQVEDSGSFGCQLNTEPMKSNVGFLQVIEQSNPSAATYTCNEDSTDKMSPKIKVSNCRRAVDIGEYIALGCRVKSNPKSMTYWKLDGEGLMSYPNIKYTSNLIDKGDNKIQMKLGIQILSPEDFGTYTCVARNSLGEDEGHIILQNKSEPLSPKCPSREGSKRSAAKSPPKIQIPNRLVAAFVLEDATLVCNVDSNPEPIVIWTRMGDEILISNNRYNISLIDTGVNKVQTRLTIKNAQLDDFGSYKCIARNSLGDASGKIIMFEKFRYPLGHSSRDELKRSTSKSDG